MVGGALSLQMSVGNQLASRMRGEPSVVTVTWLPRGPTAGGGTLDRAQGWEMTGHKHTAASPGTAPPSG